MLDGITLPKAYRYARKWQNGQHPIGMYHPGQQLGWTHQGCVARAVAPSQPSRMVQQSVYALTTCELMGRATCATWVDSCLGPWPGQAKTECAVVLAYRLLCRSMDVQIFTCLPPPLATDLLLPSSPHLVVHIGSFISIHSHPSPQY